jgi:hypothetical protein
VLLSLRPLFRSYVIDARIVDLAEDALAQRERDTAFAADSLPRRLAALDVQQTWVPGQPGAKVCVTI